MARSPVLRVAEREIQVFRKLWWGTLGFALVQPVLYLGAMGLGLGGIIDENRGDVDGLPYLAFVAPGLLAASAMIVGGSEGLWPLQGRLKWIGSYKAMVATPITPTDAFRGWLVWIGLRTTLAAAAFLRVAAAAGGGVRSPWGVLAVPAAVLCAASFAAPIGAFSARQENDLTFPLVMRLGVVPLFLFSGTFFPVEQLPDGVEPLVWLSPLWHGVELARAATTGRVGDGWLVLGTHAAVLVAVVVVGTTAGSRAFTRRLAP